MQFIDLATQQQRIAPLIEKNIRTVLEHGKYIMGPEVRELEEKLGAFVGVKHAIGCSSGTDALLLALMAYGIGPGDGVLTTPFTFIATAEVISLLGATPVFVDIDQKTFNIDTAKLRQAITALKNGDPARHPLPMNHGADSLTLKGIIAVDLFGLPAAYDQINKVAHEHGLFVIEDGAQSLGGRFHNNQACSLGNISCASFFPAKPLGCYGDGGMCFTNDDNLAERIRSLCMHGKGKHKYDNVRIGLNGRLDTLQAAILLAKFSIFPEEIRLRQEVAQRYLKLFSGHPILEVPFIPEKLQSAWAQFSLLAKNESLRNELQQRLTSEDIPTAVYYPKPLHLQSAFSFLGYQAGNFPVSEECACRIFSLPMHPYLTFKDQQRIAHVLGVE